MLMRAWRANRTNAETDRKYLKQQPKHALCQNGSFGFTGGGGGIGCHSLAI